MSFFVQARARHAEVDPAVTEHVEGRGGLGDVDRVVEREDAACRADPHTLSRAAIAPATASGDGNSSGAWRKWRSASTTVSKPSSSQRTTWSRIAS